MGQVSEVSISNLALSWLGANHITSLDDDTNEAKVCKAIFDVTRDVVLEVRDWSFATKRASLPVLSLTTTELTAHSNWTPFLVPADVIRLISVSFNAKFDDDVDWYVEDGVIWGDTDTLYIKYVYRHEDPQKYSMGFVHALAARIAMDIAVAITNSRDVLTMMTQLYSVKLDSAGTYDGVQGKNKPLRSTQLTRVR